MEAVGRRAQGPGKVYLVGGATALLLGVREQTVDIDLKLDPEPKGIFESIAWIKDHLDLNVELASPDQFIPALPGWRQRSEYIKTIQAVEFYHYDFYGQALAKILRGYQTDLTDARALVDLGKVDSTNLERLYEDIKADLIRYPSINVSDFDERFRVFLQEGRR